VGEVQRFEPQKRWGAAGLQQPPGRSHQNIMKMDPSASVIGPQDWRRILPFDPAAASVELGWVGLEAARFRATPAFELNDAVLTHHMLALFTHSGSRGEAAHTAPFRIDSVGAGWQSGPGALERTRDELHIFLEPGMVERVAAEAFALDPARVSIAPLDELQRGGKSDG
jgi:hypothetical protein